MKYVRRTVCWLLTSVLINSIPLLSALQAVLRTELRFSLLYWLPLLAVFLLINVRPLPRTDPDPAAQVLTEGNELLQLFAAVFLATLAAQAVFILAALFFDAPLPSGWSAGMTVAADAALVMIPLLVLFLNAMLRIFFASVQLGSRHHFLNALLGWIPFLGAWLLLKLGGAEEE